MVQVAIRSTVGSGGEGRGGGAEWDVSRSAQAAQPFCPPTGGLTRHRPSLFPAAALWPPSQSRALPSARVKSYRSCTSLIRVKCKAAQVRWVTMPNAALYVAARQQMGGWARQSSSTNVPRQS